MSDHGYRPFQKPFSVYVCLKADMNPLIVMAIGDQLEKHLEIWQLKQIIKFSIP